MSKSVEEKMARTRLAERVGYFERVGYLGRVVGDQASMARLAAPEEPASSPRVDGINSNGR